MISVAWNFPSANPLTIRKRATNGHKTQRFDWGKSQRQAREERKGKIMNSPNEFMASRANELRLIHLNYDAVTVSRGPCGLTSDILSATSAKRRFTAKLKLWICDFSLNRSTRLNKPFSRFDFWQTLGRNAIATVNVTRQLFERLPPRVWWTWKSVTQYHRQNERDAHEKWNGTSKRVWRAKNSFKSNVDTSKRDVLKSTKSCLWN